MQENCFDLEITIQKDKTSVTPYSLFVKVICCEPEFKKRLRNVIKSNEWQMYVKKCDFLERVFIRKPYVIKLAKFNVCSKRLFFRFDLSDDLAKSDIGGIKLNKQEDAEVVVKELRKVLESFLKKEEEIYLSI